MTRLIVWRHGQTEWNATDRVQGQYDVPLSPLGREQAAAAAARLADLHPDVIVASDLRRAADTAAALAAVTGLPVAADPRLRERHLGEWQGLTLVEVRRRWPAELDRWRAGDPSPGCAIEHIEELAKRAAAALREAAGRSPGGTVVVATHGGAARQGCAGLLGWPEGVTRTLGGLANCHWTELRDDPVRGWQLWGHNLS
ncbi:MAG TPA: histidine phosphatase family protein [Micromonosporaceae bacterium]|nr:histidine phosphatase family protein [Micromonosporaceae bacterium]